MRTKAIFFDLYQTLINVDASKENEGKKSGFKQIIVPYLQQKGISRSRASLVLSRYSDELRAFYRDHDIKLSHHSFPAILSKVFNKYYRIDISEDEISGLAYEFRKISRGYLILYAGARQALEALSAHYTLAVASNTQSIYSERELEELEISRYFSYRIYSSDIGFKKRSDNFYRECLKVINLDPKDCAMVGDNLYEDIYMARKNGFHTVWIMNPLTKDNHKAEVEPAASLPIESIENLPHIIMKIIG